MAKYNPVVINININQNLNLNLNISLNLDLDLVTNNLYFIDKYSIYM